MTRSFNCLNCSGGGSGRVRMILIQSARIDHRGELTSIDMLFLLLDFQSATGELRLARSIPRRSFTRSGHSLVRSLEATVRSTIDFQPEFGPSRETTNSEAHLTRNNGGKGERRLAPLKWTKLMPSCDECQEGIGFRRGRDGWFAWNFRLPPVSRTEVKGSGQECPLHITKITSN